MNFLFFIRIRNRNVKIFHKNLIESSNGPKGGENGSSDAAASIPLQQNGLVHPIASNYVPSLNTSTSSSSSSSSSSNSPLNSNYLELNHHHNQLQQFYLNNSNNNNLDANHYNLLSYQKNQIRFPRLMAKSSTQRDQ